MKLPIDRENTFKYHIWDTTITLPTRSEIARMDRRRLINLGLKLQKHDEDLKAVKEFVRERSWKLYGENKLAKLKDEIYKMRIDEYEHWLNTQE